VGREVEAADEFFAWADALERSDPEARAMLDAVIDMLAEKGPLLAVLTSGRS